MRVAALSVYPVKSTAPISLDEAVVHPWGLHDDRRWMVVDHTGSTITARTHRRLLWVTAEPQSDGGVELTAPDAAPLVVPPPHRGGAVPVTMSRISRAVAAHETADQWLSAYLGEPVRLVWLDDPGRRSVGEQHGGAPGDPLSLADTGPVHLTTTASLAELNGWLVDSAHDEGEPTPQPLPMGRFRPNIVVVDSVAPFAEDDWTSVQVGDVEMRFAEHCDRCVLPTIDPVTLAGSKEPTRTLALRRQWDHAVFFGIRLIPVGPGVIRVGDAVEAR